MPSRDRPNHAPPRRDLAYITNALIDADIPGIDKRRASAIAMAINNRATSNIQRDRHRNLGIVYAKWLYSGGGCFCKMEGKEELAAAHAAASGVIYEIAVGLEICGVRTWPGRDEGCKCASVPIVPGFDD